MSEPHFNIRNVRSGLLLPETLRSGSPTLEFASFEDAQHWLIHIDAPLADFEIVRAAAVQGEGTE